MTVCKYCGKTIPDNVRYCPYCDSIRPEEIKAPERETRETELLPDEVRELEFLPDEAQEPELLPEEVRQIEALPDEVQAAEAIPEEARQIEVLPDEVQEAEAVPDEVRQAEVLPDEAQQAEALSDEETAVSVEDAAEDDGWRPYRYQRRTRRSRANSRRRQPDQQTLRLLAGWLAALIVIAGGIFWYIWSENETQPQTAPLMAVITAEQR